MAFRLLLVALPLLVAAPCACIVGLDNTGDCHAASGKLRQCGLTDPFDDFAKCDAHSACVAACVTTRSCKALAAGDCDTWSANNCD